jgi:hypothetical protein
MSKTEALASYARCESKTLIISVIESIGAELACAPVNATAAPAGPAFALSAESRFPVMFHHAATVAPDCGPTVRGLW